MIFTHTQFSLATQYLFFPEIVSKNSKKQGEIAGNRISVPLYQ
ncbi:hypothetical protein AOR13_504 [Alteromonas stellipolaris LMG 21856]|nr:hypothetical protein AOR13_504 [Alteromonas stellipolaris LMG 21856]